MKHLQVADWVNKLTSSHQHIPFIHKHDQRFIPLTTGFNDSVPCNAQLISLPSNAIQVSQLLIFSKLHKVDISVKGGGYNTSGWAIKGDLIIDLGKINQVDVDTPEQDGTIKVNPLSQWESDHLKVTEFNQRLGQGGKKRGNLQSNGHDERECREETRDRQDEDQLERRPSGAGKGKARRTDPIGPPSTYHPSTSASEGTLSWIANHSQQPSGSTSTSTSSFPTSPSTFPYTPPSYHFPPGAPSFATSFFNNLPPTPSTHLDFHLHESPPSNNGFIFNSSALAHSSSLVSSPSPPTVSSPTLYQTSSSPSTLPSLLPSVLASTSISEEPTTFSTAGSRSHSSSSHSNSTSTTSNTSSYHNTTATLGSNNSTPAPPQQQHALVTIGAGAKSREIDNATTPFGFYVPLAAYPVGCAIFASGGFGFLSRLHGLSMDNVTEVELVLPDGRVVYLSPPVSESNPGSPVDGASDETQSTTEEEELWWAFRGAGLALAIVTRVRVKAFRVGLVYSGNLIYPFNPLTTPSLIKHWRDICKSAPRNLYLNLILTAGPDNNSHVVAIQMCYILLDGESDRILAEGIVLALTSWEGERCLLKDFEVKSFVEQQNSVVQVLSAQEGNRWCIRADLMNSLPDEVIYETVRSFKNIPERSAWLFEIAAGAIADLPAESSCFPPSHRSAPFQVAALHQWRAAEDDNLWIYAAQRWIQNTISPFSPGGSFPCFLESREGLNRVRNTFGEKNWDRLVKLKNRLDPDGLLVHTFWPRKDDPVDGLCAPQ